MALADEQPEPTAFLQADYAATGFRKSFPARMARSGLPDFTIL
jgi:hypothetical protein